MTELQTMINEATANDRFSGTKNPDRFFTITVVDCINPLLNALRFRIVGL